MNVTLLDFVDPIKTSNKANGWHELPFRHSFYTAQILGELHEVADAYEKRAFLTEPDISDLLAGKKTFQTDPSFKSTVQMEVVDTIIRVVDYVSRAAETLVEQEDEFLEVLDLIQKNLSEDFNFSNNIPKESIRERILHPSVVSAQGLVPFLRAVWAFISNEHLKVDVNVVPQLIKLKLAYNDTRGKRHNKNI